MENLFFYIDYFHENLENNYYIFIILYFLSLTVFYSFSLPGGPILCVTSGFLFGFYIGFLINIFSVLIGSYFFVFLSKNIFSNLYTKLLNKFSDKLEKFMGSSSFEYLVIIRLIQGNPLIIQNFLISLLNISKIKFFLTSFLGLSPAVMAFSYFGSKLFEIYDVKTMNINEVITKEFSIVILLIILFLVFKIVYKIRKEKSNQRLKN